MSKLPIIWEEYHYLHYEKSSDWKWSVGIVSITIAIISFILANITFGVLILVGTAILLIHALTPPRVLRFEINQTGIRIDQEKWSYTQFKSFWIEDNREHHHASRILFKTHNLFTSIIALPLPINIDQTDIHDIHEELHKVLPEVKIQESIFQKLLEYLGF